MKSIYSIYFISLLQLVLHQQLLALDASINNDYTINIYQTQGGIIFYNDENNTFYFKAPVPFGHWHSVEFEIEANSSGNYYLTRESSNPSGFNIFFRDNMNYSSSSSVSIGAGESEVIKMNVSNPSTSSAGGPVELCLYRSRFGRSDVKQECFNFNVASDADPPWATTVLLTKEQSVPSFRVSLNGIDDHQGASGVWKYDVQYRINNGSWTNWITGTSETVHIFHGEKGNNYFFRTRAYDNVNHVSEYRTGNGDDYVTIFYPPELLSPSDGATEVSMNPRFEWTETLGHFGTDIQYIFQLSTTESFDSKAEFQRSDNFMSISYGLTNNSKYYWRVHTIDEFGETEWSDTWSFTTEQEPAQPSYAPTVTTTSLSNITSSSARSGGNVTDDGGATVTERGICWSKSENPTRSSSSCTSDGSGTGVFTSDLTGLNPDRRYYV